MRRLRLFLTSVRYTRRSQLLTRLKKIIYRQTAQRVRPKLLGYPQWWYEPLPPCRQQETCLADVLGRTSGSAELPFEANLAGTRHIIDRETDWAVPSLSHGTRLEKLTLHYMEYLLEINPQARTTVVLDWIRNVPPWSSDYWKDDWNSYSLSIRVFTWIRILLEDGFSLDASSTEVLNKSLVRQLRFLLRNLETDIGGNHLVRNARALLAGGTWFGGTEGEKFREYGEFLLKKTLNDQLLADGMHFELSPAYHLQVTSDLVDCLTLMPRVSRAERLKMIEPMMQCAVDMTHPDGCPSLFSDGGLHMTTPPAVVLERWMSLSGSKPSPGSVWVRPEAGYAGLRFEKDFLLYDFGPIGADYLPAHGHGDIFALEWSIDGKRFVVDAGVMEYHPGDKRRRSRATASHNTVMLDREDHAEFYGSFRVGERPRVTVNNRKCLANGFAIDAEHDGYRSMPGSPIVRRHFQAKPRLIEVLDEVRGGVGQWVEAAILLAPEVEIHRADDSWLLEHGDGPVVRLWTNSQLSVEDGVWMPDFGREVPTRRVWMRHGPAPCAARWSLERVAPPRAES